ncbi:hypothetical protein [Spirulina subsalsa]|uniref:hypothetical protein n=1 Tax=Spirulina subsalsa TaxID=54311 RepID=UPI001ED99601|nr:hypothetical protein [Spirulina subsalsa]
MVWQSLRKFGVGSRELGVGSRESGIGVGAQCLRPRESGVGSNVIAFAAQRFANAERHEVNA